MYLRNGNPKAATRLILAHGAGAPMDSDFMTTLADLIAGDDLEVVRFEFPYMAQRREDGKKRPPNPAPKLLAHWRQVITDLDEVERLFIGGKSMGGRMASTIATEQDLNLAGVVCLGYPFHAPGKPEKLRVDHLPDLTCPALIIQGTRDALGNHAEVTGYDLGEKVTIAWLEDGDHDLKPRKASGLTHDQHLNQAAKLVRDFCLERR